MSSLPSYDSLECPVLGPLPPNRTMMGELSHGLNVASLLGSVDGAAVGFYEADSDVISSYPNC